MVCPTIDNPTSCKICALIHISSAKNMSAVKLYNELCGVYGHNVTSERTVTGVEYSKLVTQMFTMSSDSCL
jgi:hypothetical protein